MALTGAPPVNNPSANVHVYALAIDPRTPAIVYAGTDRHGVFKSANGGEDWIEFSNGLTNINVYVLAVNPAKPEILYAGTYGNGVFAIQQAMIYLPGVLRSH